MAVDLGTTVVAAGAYWVTSTWRYAAAFPSGLASGGFFFMAIDGFRVEVCLHGWWLAT